MPATLTYPGVYLEEIPSGVRPIAGVATSLAAFVGWAARGPTDRAVLVTSWSDFERQFGGLDARSLLGHAVYHFFNNGGSLAYIVRVVAVTDDGGDPTTAPVTAAVAVGDLTVSAKNPGAWGAQHAVSILHRLDTGFTDRFRLSVVYRPGAGATDPGIPVETFENLSMDPADPRFVVTVLAETSALVSATAASTTPPASTANPVQLVSPAVATPPGPDGTVLDPQGATSAAFIAAVNPASFASGIYLLDRVDLFNLLCVPGLADATALGNLQAFCAARRAFLIADCDDGATLSGLQATTALNGLTGSSATNAAFYFPWVHAPDPLREGRARLFPPSGFIAGLYARTDASRGVWKAPAGTEASLTGVLGPGLVLTDAENGTLNIKAINCLRLLPVYGTVAWGARTLHGDNQRGSEWKYIPVRRTALFLEESLRRGLQWVVFEPNDEPLWAQIRLNVGSFLQGLFRQGAFQGSSPREAYFVKCDRETTTAADQNLGIVNILVGFAPLKPAEFVVLKIQQIAGQTAA